MTFWKKTLEVNPDLSQVMCGSIAALVMTWPALPCPGLGQTVMHALAKLWALYHAAVLWPYLGVWMEIAAGWHTTAYKIQPVFIMYLLKKVLPSAVLGDEEQS